MVTVLPTSDKAGFADEWPAYGDGIETGFDRFLAVGNTPNTARECERDRGLLANLQGDIKVVQRLERL